MICIAGKNSIAVNALKFILENQLIAPNKIVALCNKTDTGIDDWQPSFLNYTKKSHINVTQKENLYDIEDLIFISLEYDTILQIEKFKSKKLYNIHFSKLPCYKGMYTSIWPILNGDTETGVTLHKIDNGIDTGAIIQQITFDININDTSKQLYFNYLDYGFKLFKDNIINILNDSIIEVPQCSIESTYYSRNSIDFKNITIDLNKTAYEIHNQLRAFIFPEYQLPCIQGKMIWKSILMEKPNIINEKINILENYMLIKGIDNYCVKAFFILKS